MSLVPFLAVCAAGALLGLLTLPFPRVARFVAVATLAAAFVAALAMKPADQLTVGQVQLVASWYTGLFLSAAAASCLLLCVLGLAVGWPERLAPAALATFGGLAVAFTATDPGVVFAALAASAVPAALVAIRPAAQPHALDISLAELRTLGLIAAGALVASALVLQPAWAASDPTFVFALAYLALGLAVAVRFGAVPFHVPAARLSNGKAKLGLALPLVWIPAGLGIVALSWDTSVFQSQSSWLDAAVAGVQLVAIATLVLGALGALLHNELEEIATYSIIQDAGFVLLALAARDADAAEPTRLWLLVFIVAKSALVAWVATLSSTFGSSGLQDLRGWFRRSPVLGLALVVIAVATLGWPGSAVYEARATLVRLALPSQLQFLGFVGALGALAYYGRLIAVGLVAPGDRVSASDGERLRWPRSQVAAATAVVSAMPDTAPEVRSSRSRVARAAARAQSAAEPTLTETAPEAKAREGEAGIRRSGTAGAGLTSSAAFRIRSGTIRSNRAGVAIARQLPAAWRLNRSLETSLLVLGIAAVAIAIAFGGFGATRAAATGISLDAIVAPTPQLPIIGNDMPIAPATTGSAGPAASGTAPAPGSSASAGQSAAPVNGASPSASALPSGQTGD
jgi:NADH:ubiquinone oxidoreductase subunit 2 (subunit N)